MFSKISAKVLFVIFSVIGVGGGVGGGVYLQSTKKSTNIKSPTIKLPLLPKEKEEINSIHSQMDTLDKERQKIYFIASNLLCGNKGLENQMFFQNFDASIVCGGRFRPSLPTFESEIKNYGGWHRRSMPNTRKIVEDNEVLSKMYEINVAAERIADIGESSMWKNFKFKSKNTLLKEQELTELTKNNLGKKRGDEAHKYLETNLQTYSKLIKELRLQKYKICLEDLACPDGEGDGRKQRTEKYYNRDFSHETNSNKYINIDKVWSDIKDPKIENQKHLQKLLDRGALENLRKERKTTLKQN